MIEDTENAGNTRRYFDVDSTSFERYGRQMDVKTTLCAYKRVYSRNVLILRTFSLQMLNLVKIPLLLKR